MHFFRVTGTQKTPIHVLLWLLLGLHVADAQTLKVATIAPEGSSWVKALRAIDEQIQQATEGAVQLKIYPGGVQGDEKVVLRKMRIGQLHGGGFAGQGASIVLPDILGLQMPFLFNDYDEVDFVVDSMNAHLKAAYSDKGFVHLGWADIGFVHILSKSPIRSVEDIRRHTVWRLEEEPITEVLFRLADVRSVPLSIPDVLLGLQTNMVDVVYAPPAAAIVLQWFTRVGHISEVPINYTLGAFMVSARAFDQLAPEHQAALRTISEREMRALSLKTRRDNGEALQVMKDNGLQVTALQDGALDAFRALVRTTRAELVGETIPLKTQERIETLLSAFRQEQDRSN